MQWKDFQSLRECPFCGGEARIDNAGGKYQAWCKHCCCIHIGEFYNTEAEAIAAWNRRTQPENEPLVRCGECIHFEPYDGEEHKGDCNELVGLDSCMYEDDYCSYGARKPERSEG